jgi:protein-disulfide isomerase
MRFLFRNFPLTTVHTHAQSAAEAAEAAGAAGKFWPMHDMLFEHNYALTDRDLLEYATQLGLDINAFQEAIGSHEFAGRVRSDFLSGIRSGVNGTPTFFINGERYDGSWDQSSLLAALDAASSEIDPNKETGD